MLLLCTSTLLLSFTAQPSLLNSPILTSTRRHAAAVAASTPPPPLSRAFLLLGDAGALLTWSLGLSTARTLALAGPDFDAASDLVSFMLESTMNMTVQYVAIELFSALALTLAWLVAAAIGGALDEDWFARTQSADAFGVVRSLLSSWLIAIPLAEIGKATAVAAVILPVGGWLAFDGPTAVQDLVECCWRSACGGRYCCALSAYDKRKCVFSILL